MPRVLTVDDSRAVRNIVLKQLKELCIDVDEAEDGQQALDKLEEVEVDLILLDVTMPVMDGPTMLAKLREKGRKTPVVMLTSESKRSVVAEAMRLGIDDYILKPFKPEELLKKVRTSLKLSPSAASAPAPAAAEGEGEAAGRTDAPAGKQFVDILLVDDMENVAKRLRSLLPAHITMNSFTAAQPALVACRERVFRTVLIDTEIPDVDCSTLTGQIKMLQPHAAVLALALKTTNDVSTELRAKGFSDVIFKPFTPDALEDFVQQFFDRQELLIREENVLKVGPYAGRTDHVERYFSKLKGLIPMAIEQVASACFEDVIVDLSQANADPARLPKLVLDVCQRAGAVGLTVRLVAIDQTKATLATFEETRSIPMFGTVKDALQTNA